MLVAGLLAILVLLYALAIAWGLQRRHTFIWLRGWLAQRRMARAAARTTRGPRHVLFCFVDHYEPRWGQADYDTEVRRVRRWSEGYPQLCAGHRDADGRAPQHTFFYPSEEYRPEHLDAVVALCRAGYGEIEVHLHHDDDTPAGLRANLQEFLDRLRQRHDALPLDPATGRPQWAFVHGNWALDNSRPDGRWCGVNDELSILAELGCYADFTLPSAPDATQTSTVNSLYYATDDPQHPKSHDRGEPVHVGGAPRGHLMLLQGPLGLRWKLRGLLPVPAIENGDVRAGNPPTAERVDFWIRQGIHVQGRPEWIFVKVHTHGTQERDIEALLGEPVDAMFRHLEQRYNDGREHCLHYVTAREMYNIARAAEAGESGDPGRFRDYCIQRPGYRAGAER